MTHAGRLLLILPLLFGCDDRGEPVRSRETLSPPAGTVPRGSAERRARIAVPGPEPTVELLQRGRERYTIFCEVCHGGAGYGDGVVTRRGFPAPASFHGEPVAGIAPARIVAVITEGFERMLPLAGQIPPADRWAIAYYVKALQRSQKPAGDDQETGAPPP